MTARSKDVSDLLPGSAAANETERLIAQAAKWGMEVGYFDLEDHLEPRLAALVRDSSEKLFGNCEVEFDRIQAELESAEMEWDKATRVVFDYRADVQEPRFGVIRRLLRRIRAYRDYRAACSVCRRLEPELRKLRLELDAAGSARGAATDWRKRAMETLLANYQFQKTRAAAARPVKETSHDTTETRSFIVHRAN